MKRIIIVLMLILTIFIIPLPAKADDTPKVILDGQELTFDVPPVAVDGRVLVPFRKIFEALGYTVSWQDPFLFWSDDMHWIQVGAYTAQVGSKVVNLDVPAQIVDGRAMVPLRAVAEICLCKVNYDSTTNSVYINRGSTRFDKMYLGGGYDPISNAIYPSLTFCTADGISLPFFNVSSEVAAQCSFSNYTDKPIVFDWYFYNENKNMELVFEDSKLVSFSSVKDNDNFYHIQIAPNYVAASVLPNSKSHVGKWHLKTFINGNLLAEKDLWIGNASNSNYGTIPWQHGKYIGYLLNGKEPYGYGETNLEDGTVIRGSLGVAGLMVYCADGSVNAVDPPDCVSSCIIEGSWLYSDGSQFIGKLHPCIFSKTKADLDAKKYDMYYELEGIFTDTKGTTKSLNGYFKGFDPTYRFDKILIQNGTVWDAVKAEIIK